jgi:hypothetical protein
MSAACTRAQETAIEELLAMPASAESRDFLRHCEGCESCAAELARHRRRARKGSALRPAALVAGIAAALGVGLWLLWSPGSETAARPTPRSIAEVPAAPSSGPGEFDLHSGRTLEISSASLPASGVVTLNLALVEPSASSDPLRVRILDVSGRQLQAMAEVRGPDRMIASVALEVEWLSPGSYLIELQTTERTHMPLRRYSLEIR